MSTDVSPATTSSDASGLGRFGARAGLGWLALVLGAVPFLLLWLLVQRSWSPLTGLDGEVAAGLNEVVSGSSVLVTVLSAVTDLGGVGAATLLLVLATLFLLIRRQRRLAAFVATTGIGLAVLVPVTKAVIDRARPVVDSPVVETPANASFPSGHAMTALVLWGTLLLVTLPSVHRRVRPWLVAGTVLLVVLIGLTRLALGVHFVSDVLAGWSLGAGWLAVTAAAFRGWQRSGGVHTDEELDPLDVPHETAAQPADDHRPVLPAGSTTVAALLLTNAALLAAVIVVGLLVTAVLARTWLGELDRAIAEGFARLRTPGLTPVMETLSALAATRTVIALGLAVAVLALAITSSWRPVVFVVAVLVGEVTVYLIGSRVVDRARPVVADLTSELPSAASWPSGHTAAAVATYGAVAALVLVGARSRWRWAVLALPVLAALAVGTSRMYVAAHYLTDVLAGALYAAVWVYACAHILLRRPDLHPHDHADPARVATARGPS